MKPLNIVITLIGLVIIFLGLNVGLGGIRTLGWQGIEDFIAVTNADTFAVQDNHIRFIAGVWFGVGVMFVLGGFWLDKLRLTLIALSGMIAVAGLFRLSAMDGVILSSAIAPSMVFELGGFPLLAVWLMRSRSASRINPSKS